MGSDGSGILGGGGGFDRRAEFADARESVAGSGPAHAVAERADGREVGAVESRTDSLDVLATVAQVFRRQSADAVFGRSGAGSSRTARIAGHDCAECVQPDGFPDPLRATRFARAASFELQRAGRKGENRDLRPALLPFPGPNAPRGFVAVPNGHVEIHKD